MGWIFFVDLREDARSPACYSSEESRAEVSGWVDSVARVKAHRKANDQDHKANSEGLQSLRDGVVVRIHDSQDANYERGSSDDLWRTVEEIEVNPYCATVVSAHEKRKYLIEEAIDDGEVFPRVGGKDSSCVFRSGHVERAGEVPQGI